MADDKITIGIGLDDKELKKDSKNVEKLGKKSGKSFGKGFAIAAGAAIAAGGAALAIGMRKAIEASSRQQDAVNRLNQSLISSGRFSKEASQGMQDFAKSIQQTTTTGDEAALEMLALANTFARTNDEAERMVEAALELKAAMGIELESGIRNLGKTFSGLQGELGEALPALRNLTQEELKAGAATDLIRKKFEGFAASQRNTFSGAMESTNNSFGDFMESVGNLVTTSPIIVGLVNKVGDAMTRLTKKFDTFGKDNNFIKNMLTGLITFAQGVNTFVVLPLSGFFDAIEIGFRTIQFAMAKSLNTMAIVASKFADFFSEDSEMAQNLRLFKEASAETLEGFSFDMVKSIDNAFGFETSTKIEDFLANVGSAVDELALKTTLLKDTTGGAKKELVDNLFTVGDAFDSFSSGFDTQMTEIAKTAKNNFNQVGKAMTSTLATGAANAFSAFGQAIVKGENAMQAFAGAMLAAFGQAAIQLGTQFILQGIAMSWAGWPNGPALIGAGAALATFGGVLTALGPGGGEVAGGGAGAVTQPSPVEPVTPDDPEEQVVEQQGPSTSVSLNIQGNVLDRRETGLELAEVLRETFQTNDIVFT